jgi:hypothetical protein
MTNRKNRSSQVRSTPQRKAWITAFFIENHLDHYVYQEHVANPEQVRFMVFTEQDERYYPCSDRMFEAIISRKADLFLKQAYDAVLERIICLIEGEIEDTPDKKYLESLVKIKFKHETRDYIMIPSRLEKRLIRIFLERTKIEDPWFADKLARNDRMGRILGSTTFKSVLDHSGSLDFMTTLKSLSEIRGHIEQIELKRLITLSVDKRLWETDMAQGFTASDYLNLFERDMRGDGVEPLFRFLGIGPDADVSQGERSKKILWLADEAGEIMVDLAIIQYLVKLGHKVIISFKDGPLYEKVSIHDVQKDPLLHRMLEGAFFIDNKAFSKNELVGILRSDYDVIAISDGTRESPNLLLASTTFARLFKEVDGIISRGGEQKRRFFDTHFQFTQDIYNICPDPDSSVRISFKPKHKDVVKFSHRGLESKARSIIDKMVAAKSAGMTVIFYSAIIGSIPGKIKTAKEIISVFVKHLKAQFADTFIINPGEYFEPGMDADDLMYMWEIVQKSGFINTWRFQTYEDIAKAFQIMGKKVPPEWVGKDATFSTGCTKEMNIALNVLKSHPEMQVIGPAREKFMRRKDYGVGKMYDTRLSDSS